MLPSIDINFIWQKAAQRNVEWSIHALNRLAVLPYTVRDIETSLEKADVIEIYSQQHRYLPDCLTLSFLETTIPIHCVVAVNEASDLILIVTVYQPSEDKWEHDWKTRK